MADSIIVMTPLVLSFAVCLFAFPNNIHIIIINHEIVEAILSSIFLNRPVQTNNLIRTMFIKNIRSNTQIIITSCDKISPNKLLGTIKFGNGKTACVS